ncbi:MAG: CRTAC1 family protein, partial [Verrucomicrobiota bacterium]
MSIFLLVVVSGLVAALPQASALDWQNIPGARVAPLPVPQQGKAGFSLMPSALTGINFTNFCSEKTHLTNQIYLNGSGVAAGDVDGDGWCDLYFCSLDGPNALYRNLGGWKFQDITDTTIACPNLAATGAAFADLDGDGDLDLIVNSIAGGSHIFSNDGQGHFERRFLLNEKKGGMSLALADIDGDGYLDLYIANYRTSALMDMVNARGFFKIVNGERLLDRIDGRSVTEPDLANRFVVNARGGVEELGELDVFYRNQSGTNFEAISFTGGAFLDEDGKALSAPPFDWGLTVTFHDINDDRLPDIYVCNDFQSVDRIWLNLGGGRFQALPRLAMRKSSVSSMGMDFADINRDGYDDFFVLDMLSRDHKQRLTQMTDVSQAATTIGEIDNRPQCGFNTLFLNRGDGTFAEIAQLSGLEAAEWSWSPVFLDVDLDGWEDMLIVNGNERAARDFDVTEQLKRMRAERRMSDAEIFQARRAFPRLTTANIALRNRHDLTFEEVSRQWGFDFAGVSQAMALADLDQDGDQEVIVNNFDEAAGLYRNDSNAPRIAVCLKGQAPNTAGIGAKVKIFGGPVTQSQEIICGGRYLSSDEPMRVFAVGAVTNELSIEVTWRSGHRSVIKEALPNHVYEIDEAAAVEIRNPQSQISDSNPQPVFEDVSHLLGHVHRDEPFDDFARQPLLPNRLSQLGPGITWFDVDEDGWDDLIIGSGKGGQLAIYRNLARDGFKPVTGPPLTQPVTRDHTTVLGWSQGPGQAVLLAGSSNYEDGLPLGSPIRQFNLGKKTVE